MAASTAVPFNLVALTVAAMIMCGAGGAEAQSQERLEDIERRLSESRTAVRKLEAQERKLAEEVDSLRRESVRLAAEAQDYEASLIEVNRALSRLAADEARTRAGLAAAREQSISLLAALQRMARQPRQVMVVRPAGPVDTVRSSMLLQAALPAVQQKAAALKASLDLLARLRDEKARALDRQSLTADERARTSQRIEANLDLKRKQLDEIRRRRARVQDGITSDERAAETLRELFVRIDKEKKRAAEQERLTRLQAQRAAGAVAATAPQPGQSSAQTGPVPRTRTVTADPTAAAQPQPRKPYVDIQRPRALRKFPRSRARSDLRFPVVGEIVRKFGEKDNSGTPSRGVSLRPLAGARVVAPYDGQVKFSAPFRGYGNMIIIEHTDDYFSVLAGMERIDAVNGDWVLAGEPIGLMPDGEAPVLYMELRRLGKRLDPLPWLRIRRADAGGGSG